MDQRDRLASQPTLTMESDRFEWFIVAALCGALAIAVIFIYLPSGHHGFVDWDDPAYVTDNSRVRRGLSWQGLRWAFTQSHAANWHPLTWLSHMVDCQLFGVEQEDAGGHHLVSVALHAANSVLLVVVLRWMTGALWPSALVAALFAVHPLRVESVAWISERKDVLSGFFFVLTLLAYCWYTQSPKLWRYASVLLLLTLGLMAKPMLVTVPFVLLLLDFWPLGRMQLGAWSKEQGVSNPKSEIRNPKFLRLLSEKVPLLVLSTVSCLITVSVQRAGGAVVSVEGLPWTWRFVATPLAYLMYLGKTIWPTNLAFFYPHPASFANENFLAWTAGAVAAFFLLTAVTVVVFLTARRWPYLVVGWLWFIGMLVPVIGLMQVGNHFWADRYAYLPLVGVYLMLAWGLLDLVSRLPQARLAIVGIMCCVLLAMTVAARAQVRVWRENQTLFSHALAVTRNNYVAHNNLGSALQDVGRLEDAVLHYQEALRIKPDYARAHNNLGHALQGVASPKEVLAHFQEALRIEPDYAEAHNNLGNFLQTVGRSDDAVAHYQEALRIKPDYAEAHYNWGTVLHNMGRIKEAAAHYQEALRIKPNYADAHSNLGTALQNLGHIGKAIAHYQEALRIKPDYALAHYNLGNALRDLGRFEDAIAHYQDSLRIEPDYAEAHNSWGIVLARQGRLQDATTHFEHAVRLKPKFWDARDNLRRAQKLLQKKRGPAQP